MKNTDFMFLEEGTRQPDLLMELHDVSKTLDGKKIIDHLNVRIPSNRIVGLVGDNGRGKSTLLRLMAGIWKADEGEVIRYTHRISYLIPGNVFYEWMRVKDVVQFYSLHYQRFQAEKAWDLIRNADFDERMLLRKLSDGQRERLLLILAICVESDLYLLDEPVNGTDAAFKKDIRRFLMEHLPEGAAIVMATHLLRDFEQLFDQVLFLDHRGIMQVDTEEIRADNEMSIEQYYLEKFHR